jgi:hypothetical protein
MCTAGIGDYHSHAYPASKMICWNLCQHLLDACRPIDVDVAAGLLTVKIEATKGPVRWFEVLLALPFLLRFVFQILVAFSSCKTMEFSSPHAMLCTVPSRSKSQVSGSGARHSAKYFCRWRVSVSPKCMHG